MFNILGMTDLLKVSDLRIAFHSRGESNEVVHGIDFTVQAGGQTVAILGESGSGKSVSCMALTQLLPTAPSCTVSGGILFKGQDVLQMNADAIRSVRGRGIAYIFQEASSSLNPVFTVGYQIAEAVKLHPPDLEDVKGRVVELLELVGIRDAAKRYKAYPHEMSGGMQQRVGLARALTCDTEILMMDEAFSALDPLIRSDMQDLLLELQSELHKTVIFITHDLDEALKIGDQIAILNGGELIQHGSPQDILMRPADDYVKDFVKKVNRSHVLHAESVMISDKPSAAGTNVIVKESDTIDNVLCTLLRSDAEYAVVQNDSGADTGYLTKHCIAQIVKPVVDDG
mgnify:CR=1 FL=1